jgi:hypothetical protein
MTDQERIKRINKGKDPNFLKEIDELFRKPVIAIQLPAHSSTQEKGKPNLSKPHIDESTQDK